MQDNLILLRKNNFVTQKRIANLLGISEVQYGKKEKGLAAFTQDEMFVIADYFELKVDDIFLPRKATKCCKKKGRVREDGRTIYY